MEPVNDTSVKEFILMGLPHSQSMKIPIITLFLCIYVLTLLGNLLFILAVRGDSHLHRPMYIFLMNLSFLDICLSTVTEPKMLNTFLENNKVISFNGCITQLYFYHFFGSTECFLYTVMAYDRFLAICQPLRYSILMSLNLCKKLASGIWVSGSIHAMIHTMLTFRLRFCGPNRIDYFFCDVIPLLKLACQDTTVNKVMIITNIGAVALICFVIIVLSYIHIIANIMKISILKDRKRTFSTCASHLISVSLFYGPPVFIYLSPGSMDYYLEETIAVFYTTVTPMLNPIIYSLRNKEVKTALKKITCNKQ
ncbi:hypothetical protein GDO86_001634 [Hymenochirus boettgeri]|uniref:G-protein coupled receptors family 1 profile domain-containing protein n=1 Tax=Hymenochirus boettgeri TaxID=247094 RepID=A0A8T2KDJ4_9PIPI|nr:hypothetical protein GDO86_001634 [Hymenochirus boettgeri]